jgi:hypothetical protein
MLQQLHRRHGELAAEPEHNDLDRIVEEALFAGLASPARAEFVSSLRRWMALSLDGLTFDTQRRTVREFAAPIMLEG